MPFPDDLIIEDGDAESPAVREEAAISAVPGQADRDYQAGRDRDRTAGTETVAEDAASPGRRAAKDETAKRGREMIARLVRMHGGQVRGG